MSPAAVGAASVPDTTEELVYHGRRTGTGRKIVYEYQREGAEDSVWYKAPLVTGAAVGAVVLVTRPGDDPRSIYMRGPLAPRVIRQAEVDEVTMLRWQVADRAAHAAKAQEDAAKRAARDANALEPLLDRLEAAARGLNSIDRAAFARYVSDRIRGN